jgi:hypothetical protein
VYRPAAVEDAGTKLLVEVPKVSGDLVEDQAEPSRRAAMDLTFTVIIRCEERFDVTVRWR